jgi:hypothetical protein
LSGHIELSKTMTLAHSRICRGHEGALLVSRFRPIACVGG